MPKVGFSAMVEAWLKSKDLNAFRAQSALGATDTTISNWISGRALPPSTRLPSLAAALGMPLADLSALVARERSARLRRRRSAGGVVAGHVVRSSCQQPATKPARSPGHKAAAVAGAAGKVKS
jgi:hypothetical protein